MPLDGDDIAAEAAARLMPTLLPTLSRVPLRHPPSVNGLAYPE